MNEVWNTNMKDMFAELRQMRSSENVDKTNLLRQQHVSPLEKDVSEQSDSETLVSKTSTVNDFQEEENFTCSYCHEKALIEDEGVFVCNVCFCENGPVITGAQEWRGYSDSSPSREDPSRCGMPVNPLLPQSSLGCVIGGYGSQTFRKLQLQNAMPSHEKTLWDALKNIRHVARKARIPGTLADKACYLYAELTKNVKIKRGPARKGLQAYCLYVFCKEPDSGYFICKQTLASEFAINIADFHEGSTIFSQLSYYKTQSQKGSKQAWSDKLSASRLSFVKPTSPENYIQKACQGLSFSSEQISEVVYISRATNKLGLVAEKMPQSIAAGCLILYVKEKKIRISVKKISELCEVSNITADGAYKELRKVKEFLFPTSKKEMVFGKVGDCRPPKKLEAIYKAPSRAIPPTIRICSGPITV